MLFPITLSHLKSKYQIDRASPSNKRLRHIVSKAYGFNKEFAVLRTHPLLSALPT